MRGKCDNKEEILTECIRSVGFRDIRKRATLQRVTLQWLRCTIKTRWMKEENKREIGKHELALDYA